jgi:chromosome segregation protein
VALLLAIFRFKPSPFCILDEVDAPLDEANVERYIEGVRAMTDRSQFILITHSKRTMQSCDVLYGVTMQEPGVSKLVGVRVGDGATRSSARTHSDGSDGSGTEHTTPSSDVLADTPPAHPPVEASAVA